MTPLDPRDPQSFAFYQTFIAPNRRRRRDTLGCGGFGCGFLMLFFGLGLILAALFK
jgi:hypothetical protein